jgi:RNA polymerase sigma factor (sigma-70 family)
MRQHQWKRPWSDELNALWSSQEDIFQELFAKSIESRRGSDEVDRRPGDPAGQVRSDQGEQGQEQCSPEWATILRCVRRIRKWRVPPHWSERDWQDEIRAEVMSAVTHASREYDPGRSVPLCAFLHMRIMHSVLARYRREWTYAIHRSLEAAVDDYEAVESGDYPSRAAIGGLLRDALAQLPSSDASLIEGLFWEGKSEARVAQSLGISQQAVNKRKHNILNNLERMIKKKFA